MSRFAVTGCAGFIGSHLVDALLVRGHEVVGIDSFSDYYARARKDAHIAGAIREERFELIEGDLTQARVTEIFGEVDGIFHLAAQPGVRGSWGETFEIYVRDNILATQRVFEAAVEVGARVVFASTSSVYGDAEAYPTSEETVPRPISPYGVTKLSCERLAEAYAASFPLDVVSLRYFTVYGARQRPDMAFHRVVSALLRGREFEVYGDGRQSRDFTFVSDAVQATLLAMERAPRGRVYNVGGGNETTLRDVIVLCERLGDGVIKRQHLTAVPGDVQRTAADTTRIRQELGWRPGVGLEEGLRAQLDWLSSLPAEL